MTEDARQSLTALGSVTLFVGIVAVSGRLLKAFDMPVWVLIFGMVLMTFDFGWRFLRWVRAKRVTSSEDRA